MITNAGSQRAWPLRASYWSAAVMSSPRCSRAQRAQLRAAGLGDRVGAPPAGAFRHDRDQAVPGQVVQLGVDLAVLGVPGVALQNALELAGQVYPLAGSSAWPAAHRRAPSRASRAA